MEYLHRLQLTRQQGEHPGIPGADVGVLRRLCSARRGRTLTRMHVYLPIGGPLAGGPVFKLPEGYTPVFGSSALAVWAEDPNTAGDIRAVNEPMLSALYTLDAEIIRSLKDGNDVVARDDETRQAIADFREASEQQSILLRSI